MEKIHKLINVDYNITDPQFCAMIASDIYKNLHDSEVCHLKTFPAHLSSVGR